MFKDILRKIPKKALIVWSTALLIIVTCETFLTIIIPTWREYFFNTLQTKNAEKFTEALLLFTSIMTVLGFAQGLKAWTGYRVSFLIRESTTKLMFKKWVHGKKDNPAYGSAFTESLQNATELYLEIIIEVIISLTIVVALILSNLHHTQILIASVLYTIVISGVAALFNKPLVNRDSSLQMANGIFRSNLTNLASGTDDMSHKAKWLEYTKCYYSYIKVSMYFNLFTRLKSSLAMVIPYLLLAGPYFANEITLGAFMGGAATFELIVVNSTILLLLYPKLAKARASARIVRSFYNGLDEKEGAK